MLVLSVLPTYVGVILGEVKNEKVFSGTTHIRGGDPIKPLIWSDKDAYYPHTWG